MKHKDGKEETSDHCWIGGKRYACLECVKASREKMCPYRKEDEDESRDSA